MTDIVERLRCLHTGNPVGTDTIMIGHPCHCQVCEAADEIEHRLERLRDALEAMILNMKNDGGEYRDCYKNAVAVMAKSGTYLHT
jgi:hypothetical protein